MNPYITLGCVGVGLMVWLGSLWFVHEYDVAKCTVADQKAVVVAQQTVIKKEENSTKITNNTGESYVKQIHDIDSKYNVADSVQQPTGNRVPTVSQPTSRVATISKVYKLTLKQCDEEEAKYNLLWNWVNQQAQVYNGK